MPPSSSASSSARRTRARTCPGLVRMIHAAYEVLSDPDRRRRYDAQLAHEASEADEELKSTLDTQPAFGARHVQEVPASLRSVFPPLAA